MQHAWYRQFWRFLQSREAVGVILVAGASAIAMGVIPNLLQKWWDSAWFYGLVFFGMLLVVVLGWALVRERGVGVVLSLYPNPQANRVSDLTEASRKNHSSTLVIDDELLRPGGRELSLDARMDLLAKLVDARVEEIKTSGADGSVTLYPLAHLYEGFHLGRRLARDTYSSLSVMHLSSTDQQTVVPGLTLGNHLRDPLTPDQEALLTAHLKQAPGTGGPTLVANPGCPAEYQHRLAFIVRLSFAPSMTADATGVAETGRVRRPSDATHTGYVFTSDNHEANGNPCGAHAVLEAASARLPETKDAEVFEAVANYTYRCCIAAKQAWAEQSGSTNVDVQLFINAPLPITIAVGWLMKNDHVTVIRHESSLLNAAAPTGAPPAAPAGQLP
ncbi:hypothetical protein ACWFQ6_06690 [Streptomyces althioticus]|uniref:hypothetical protein n=1 Tax=Streptomyces TaxID=1883 RepID=UPI0010C15203|nr:hypothetical protein [Streptomyces sp. MD20-1-1]WTB49346.1 hypothetical protein OG968_25200 [Streptomyces althioticus]